MPSRPTPPPLLSLMLAALVLTTGCVTVRAPGPAEAPGPARTVGAARQPAAEGLPLGPAPEPQEPSPPPASEAAPAAP
ncbi:hypothetical protein AB0E73_19780, partial [Streptomyces sp. NPDC031705]